MFIDKFLCVIILSDMGDYIEKISDIAKWFINEPNPDPLKLQKLLYISQGISYSMNDYELFNDELEV